MSKKNKLINILFIILIVIFSFSVVVKEFQNDTFFTIALGEKIIEEGISLKEKLVWHENLEFQNPRWLFDLTIATIYNWFNFSGIYIFTAIATSLQGIFYYIMSRKITNNSKASLLLTLMILIINFNEFTARAQVLSFLLFLIEFYCIENLLETNKKRYFITLSIIPFILANIHGTIFPMYFVFYLPYIAEYFLSKLPLIEKNDSKIIIQKRNIKKIFLLLIIGIISGFCTPKGLNPYSYMFKIMSGISTAFISELQPVNFFDHIEFSILIILVLSIIMFTKTHIQIVDCFFILGFAFMTFSTYRCIYFFYLIASLCIVRILTNCLREYQVSLSFLNSNIKSILFTLIIFIFILDGAERFLKFTSQDYVKNDKYPIKATEYILNNLDISSIKLYNGFNFGSYLEFKGVPAFMDSRSELFTESFNDNITILNDYYDMFKGVKSYKSIFPKYDITHALLENDELINQYMYFDSNWNLIYSDSSWSLYEKIK